VRPTGFRGDPCAEIGAEKWRNAWGDPILPSGNAFFFSFPGSVEMLALHPWQGRGALLAAIAIAAGCTAGVYPPPAKNVSAGEPELARGDVAHRELTPEPAPHDAAAKSGEVHKTDAPQELAPAPSHASPENAVQPASVVGPVAPVQPDRARLYAPAGLVKIYDRPDRDAPVIGAFRAGQSVVMKDTNLTPDRQYKREYLCDEGWYPIEPRGFVCVGGGDHATKDGEDARVLAARAALPDTASDYPFHYGVSVGAPQYRRIPTAEEQREHEKDLDAYLAHPAPADEDKGGTVDTRPSGQLPAPVLMRYLQVANPPLLNEKDAYAGMKVSWTQEFDANGRTWLLTPDMTFVPKDKVRQKKQLPNLKGIALREHPEMKLPLAFFWTGNTPAMRMNAQKQLEPSDKVFTRHTFAKASLEQVQGPHGIVYWRVDGDWYVPYNSVSMIKKAEWLPPGVQPKDKWVEVRVSWGYLVAYEGIEPVYVTAISPGMDGVGNTSYSTARGRQYVQWKLLSGDMSGRDKGTDWYVQEVPWVQYYKDNFALHGAWWHDDFGRPKSHGCINISPPDARHLFNWMDPPLPEGWYAVSPYAPAAPSTLISIRP
jgi:hypothetical protein